METLYENTCLCTEQHLYEMTKNTIRPFYAFYNKFMITFLLVCGILILFTPWYICAPAMFCGSGYLIYSYHGAAKKQAAIIYARNQRDYGREVQVHTDFFEDHLVYTQDVVK